MVQALQKMSRIEYLDVRHQQLECVLQVSPVSSVVGVLFVYPAAIMIVRFYTQTVKSWLKDGLFC